MRKPRKTSICFLLFKRRCCYVVCSVLNLKFYKNVESKMTTIILFFIIFTIEIFIRIFMLLQMAIFGFVILSILLIQASSKAAPSSDVAKSLDEIKNIEDGPKLDDEPHGTAEDIKTINESENNGRQKRYYDYVEFGLPPMFESNFPFPSRFNYNKRDESQNTGVYGSEDSLLSILRALQRILNDARRQQSTPQPPRVHIPTYIPIFYLPQACECNNNVPQVPINNGNNKETNNKDISHNNNKHPPPPTVAPSSEVPPTVPDLPNRFPQIDDMRQNWGTVVDQNRPSDESNDDDGNRPISLEPVDLPGSVDIPVPPVEHGSVQAGSEPVQTTTEAVSGTEKASSNEENGVPSLCDAAIVSCCVRKAVTYSCFAQQGCPDPSFNGNPCEPQNFRQVLNRVHAYVRQRNG